MTKRIKKPPVKPEKRLEWLHRVEKDGETFTHIAESDGFDIRTVRKHVDLARMERDVHQARTEVLRSALEGHYSDLLETVRDIENQVVSEKQVSLDKDIPLISGLRQHMPRSPLWENLRKWNQTLIELAELEDMIRNKLQKEIAVDGRLDSIISQGSEGATPAAVNVLVYQMEQWTRGLEGLKIDRDIRLEKAPGASVGMSYGFSHFGEINMDSVDIVKALLIDFERNTKDWPEYLQMEKLSARLRRLKKSIGDILTAVLLRRIVPGRCKYCPL
jgi:hypothetical protein